jgi:mannose-6-phosphate isomerase-like protein (cupin superfamily)
VRVTIEGTEPFVATKGFMVNVPFRHVYTIENVGDKPALWFQVHQAGSEPFYPDSETPDPVPGRTYIKVNGNPGPAKDRDTNPIYVDFFKTIGVGDKPYNGKFVWDDHFTSNILRGPAPKSVAPDTNKGHFHSEWTEFWFIMEGRVGYKIEGFPYFVSEAGDVVAAMKGRWHRPGNDPSAPMSTRIPINPRPVILHNFEPAH